MIRVFINGLDMTDQVGALRIARAELMRECGNIGPWHCHPGHAKIEAIDEALRAVNDSSFTDQSPKSGLGGG